MATQKLTISLRNVITDAVALLFILFMPALSHLTALPLYLLDPMRLAVLGVLLVTRDWKNTVALAVLLPLFSAMVSGHPVFPKCLLISVELAANVLLLEAFVRLLGRQFDQKGLRFGRRFDRKGLRFGRLGRLLERRFGRLGWLGRLLERRFGRLGSERRATGAAPSASLGAEDRPVAEDRLVAETGAAPSASLGSRVWGIPAASAAGLVAGLAAFLSIALSKALYYLLKWAVIAFGWMQMDVVSTALWIQLLVAIAISLLFALAASRRR